MPWRKMKRNGEWLSLDEINISYEECIGEVA